MRCLAVFLLLATPVLADPLGPAAETIPIFDAHVHYKEPAWAAYPPKTVIEIFDRNGIAMALVSSTPDDGTIKLWEHAPARIVPELRPYHGPYGSRSWMADPARMARYIEDRLARYPHEGIGEFHVHNMDGANLELLETVAGLALARDIPIHIHSDDAPVRHFFDIAPNLTIIWAHAGMSSPPEVIGPLMDAHPRLFADLSYRESDILRGPALQGAWEDLLIRHADRFMVGSDTWVNGQWDDYDALIERNRRILALLPREVAEQIAYENAERLFGRTVTRALIGTR